MKLSDVVSSLHLPIFAELPLLVFMGIFVCVGISLLGGRERFEAESALPLHDEHNGTQGDPT